MSTVPGTPAIPGATVGQIGPLIGDQQANAALFITAQRNIGGIFPHVTMEEVHRDEALITQHPVEVGAPITDHAFMQPPTIEIRCGFSDSSARTAGFAQQAYNALLNLQKSFQLFSVTTGKRLYKNMLIRSILIRTDESSEWALMVVALCQQVFLTSTQGATVGGPTPAPPGKPSGGFQSVAKQDPTSGVFTLSGGASPVEPGMLSVGSGGGITWSNSPFNGGTQLLVAK